MKQIHVELDAERQFERAGCSPDRWSPFVSINVMISQPLIHQYWALFFSFVNWKSPIFTTFVDWSVPLKVVAVSCSCLLFRMSRHWLTTASCVTSLEEARGPEKNVELPPLLNSTSVCVHLDVFTPDLWFLIGKKEKEITRSVPMYFITVGLLINKSYKKKKNSTSVWMLRYLSKRCGWNNTCSN